MILPIILLVVIILIIALLIWFLFFILMPSVKKQTKIDVDPIISQNEKNYVIEPVLDYKVTKLKAVVKCSCSKKFAIQPETFNEQHTCFMTKMLNGSGSDCKYACIGLGDCAKVCPQKAIVLKNQTAIVTKNCCGCGKCVDVCPQKLIELVDSAKFTSYTCQNCKEQDLTSCSEKLKEQNCVWEEKKDFKIWAYCYRIFKRIKEIF